MAGEAEPERAGEPVPRPPYLQVRLVNGTRPVNVDRKDNDQSLD
jgi:hypothetical protein